MSVRAMWKAELCIGDETIPVKLYSAAPGNKLGFRLVHKEDGVPVKQRLVDAEDGDEVSREDLLRAYEVESGTLVTFTREELDAFSPEPSRSIEFVSFVPQHTVDPQLFVRPYWLGPDGDDDGYFALAESLASDELLGVAHWVMRGKAYAGVLSACQGHLLLTTVRDPATVVAIDQIDAPTPPTLDSKELALAKQLVETLHGAAELDEFVDERRRKVEQVVDEKRGQKRGQLGDTSEPSDEVSTAGSLARALRDSLTAARKEKRSA